MSVHRPIPSVAQRSAEGRFMTLSRRPNAAKFTALCHPDQPKMSGHNQWFQALLGCNKSREQKPRFRPFAFGCGMQAS